MKVYFKMVGTMVAMGAAMLMMLVPVVTGDVSENGGTSMSPVIFIPGDGGSRLEARHGDAWGQGTQKSCPKQTDWFRLWLNVWDLVFGNQYCFTETIRLNFNKTTRTSRNADGVNIRVPGFGNTETVEYLDPSWTAWALGNVGEYAKPLISALVSAGYVRGRSVRAAPYDFRYAPHSSTMYFMALKALIEETYTMNNDQKVTMVAHSLGGTYGLYFLRKQPAAWKNKYISGFVTINTPWTGVSSVMQLFASGDTLGSSSLNPWVFRGEQRTSESNMYMLPQEGSTPYDYHPGDIIIQTPNGNYSSADIDRFFVDLGFPIGIVMRRPYSAEEYEIKDPGVKFHCVLSNGYPVGSKMVYDHGWDIDRRPRKAVLEDGDGTVNLRSLQGCSKVTLNTPGGAKDFKVKEIPHASHGGILKDDRLKEFLLGVLKEQN